MCECLELNDIVTPVDVEELDVLLKLTKYSAGHRIFLVDGFTNGFRIGYRGDRSMRRLSPNLKLRVGSELILWNKVMKEVAAGRFASPYREPPYEAFIQSPIGLVPKSN